MNSSKIEEIAVATIKNEVLRNDYLANEIPVNDKTPSWDGEIWVYDNPKQTKDKLFGKVPVQVKGKKVSKINKESKFQIKKVDLDNYYKNGGVIFFVVEFLSFDQSQIFYKELLPLDLKKILEDIGIKKSVSISLKRLVAGERTLEFICRNFIYHSRKQGLPLLIDKNIDYDNIKIKIFTPSPDDFKNQLLKYGTYAYGHIEHLNLDIPLYKMDIQEIAEGTDLWIGINREKCYTDIVRIISIDKIALRFGQGFEIILPKDFSNENSKDPFKINFKEKGSIQERIIDIKFMLEIIANNSVNINGSIIELNNFENKSRFDGLSTYLDSLEEIVETFNKLNINFNEHLDYLNQNDWNSINALVQIVLHKNYGPIRLNRENPFLHFRVANLKIVLFTTIINEELRVYNLFNFDDLKKYLKVYTALSDNSSQRKEHSPFLLFEPSYLLEISNFDHNIVEASFKSVDYNSDLTISQTNDYMLKILNYFDEHSHRSELLTLTLSIFNDLVKYSDDNILYFINKMQIIKRMRAFTDCEKVLLIEKKHQYTHIPDINCAFSILLDSKIEFEVNINLLLKDEREKFYTYPIYTLAKKWY